MEATNICYCLLRDIPFKGWKTPVPGNQGAIEYYLHNADLASEVSAGGVKSITNLCIVHKVLSQKVGLYDHKITTTSEDCLSGTAWKTGRMRAPFLVSGNFFLMTAEVE